MRKVLYQSGGSRDRQDVTPELASVEEDFAVEEPESSAGDSQDGLAEQGTVGWHEHQVKID